MYFRWFSRCYCQLINVLAHICMAELESAYSCSQCYCCYGYCSCGFWALCTRFCVRKYFSPFLLENQTVLASIRHVINIQVFITVYLYIPIFCFCTFVYFMLGCTDFIAFFSTCHYLLSLRVLREILNWLMAHRLCGNLSTCVLKAFSPFAAKNIMFPTEFDFFFCCYCDFSLFVLCKYCT